MAQAFLTTDQRDKLVELYVGYFNRAPEAAGLNYWSNFLLSQLNQGVPEDKAFRAIADQFYDAGVQYGLYSSAMTPEEFVIQSYKNVLGRDLNTESAADKKVALDYWVPALQNGVVSKGQFILQLIEDAKAFKDDPTWGWVAQYLDARTAVGVEFSKPEYSAGLSGTDAITKGQAALSVVTKGMTAEQALAAFQESGAGATGKTFTLTSNSAVLTDTTSNGVTPAGHLTAANDKIDALNLLSSSVVIKDASTTDSDTLSAIVNAKVSPLVTNIENIDVTFTGTGAGELDASNISGAKVLSINAASTAAGKFSGLSPTAAPTIRLGATTQTLTVAQTTDAGTADVLNVALAGSKGGLTLDDGTAGGALETLNIDTGTIANKLTIAVDGVNTTGVTKTVITGSGDLTLVGAVNGQLSGAAAFAAIDAGKHTGVLTLQIGDTSAATGITDTAISLANYKGVDKVVLNDDTVVNVTGASSGITVDLNSDAAFTTFTVTGSAAVSDAASNADVVNINLTGAKTAGTSSNVTGALTFTGFETLNLKSTGIAHTIDDLTTAGSNIALDTVNISGDKDLTLTGTGGFSGVEKIDATGFTGKLIMGAAGVDLLVLTGGDGNDTLYSGGNSSAATVVKGGAGNDTIIFGANTDNVFGGDGADIFDISTLTNVLVSQNDVINDFTSGTDVFKVGATIKAATTAATLTVQDLTWNTNLVTTIGAGTYATANAAYLVKVTNDGGVAGATNYYLVVDDGSSAFEATNDGVIKLAGVTSLTTADFVA